MKPQIETFDLEGVKLITPKKNIDERGFFCEVLRHDWKEFFGMELPQQLNFSKSFPGVIRAWHRHDRGQFDYFLTINGAYKVCIYDGDKNSKSFGKLEEIVVSEDKLQVLKYPGKYWHGTKVVSSKPGLACYLSNTLYDYNNPDEERKPWNSVDMIDPKTNKPYDWNKPPHK